MLADSLNESKLLIDEIKPLYDIFQSANKYLAQNKVTKEVVKSLNAESVIPEFEQILEEFRSDFRHYDAYCFKVIKGRS